MVRRKGESPGKKGDSPLHLAVKLGNLGKVKEIGHSKSTNNLLSKQNQKVRQFCMLRQRMAIVWLLQELLKHLDLQTTSILANNGFDTFHTAAKQGHLDESYDAFFLVHIMLMEIMSMFILIHML